MAAASWKGSIAWGLLTFPVRVRGAVRETTFSYNTHHDPALCAAGGSRLAQGPSVCTGCGDDVAKDAIVKGFEGRPGIDTDYLASLDKAKGDVLPLDKLHPAGDIDPRYFAKSYDVIAGKGGEKAYVLLHRTLTDEGAVATGTICFGGAEHIVVIRPRGAVLSMELLYWPEEVDATGSTAEAAKSIDGVAISDQEAAMGRQLAAFMSAPFDPSVYRNERAAAVSAYLNDFLQGKEAPAAIVAPVAASPVLDLAAALAASIAERQADAGAKVAAKTGGRKGKVAA